MGYLEVLLQDILIYLVEFLPAQDLVKLRLVCRSLNVKVTAALSQAFMSSRVGRETREGCRWSDMARSAYYEQAHSNFLLGVAGRARNYPGAQSLAVAGRYLANMGRTVAGIVICWEAMRPRKREFLGGVIEPPESDPTPGIESWGHGIRINEDGCLYLRFWDTDTRNPNGNTNLRESMWHLPAGRSLWLQRVGRFSRNSSVALGKQRLYIFQHEEDNDDERCIEVVSLSSGESLYKVSFPFPDKRNRDMFTLVSHGDRKELLIYLPEDDRALGSVSFVMIDGETAKILHRHHQTGFIWVEAVSQLGGFVMYTEGETDNSGKHFMYQGVVSLKDDCSFRSLEVSAIISPFPKFMVDPETKCGVAIHPDNKRLVSFSLTKVPKEERIPLPHDVPQYRAEGFKLVFHKKGWVELPAANDEHPIRRLGPCTFSYSSPGQGNLVDFREQRCPSRLGCPPPPLE